MRCIEIFHTKNRTDSPKLRSPSQHHNNNVCGGGVFQPHHSNNSIGSCSIAEHLSCDDDTVFDSSNTFNEEQQHSSCTKTLEDDLTTNNITNIQNTHAKLKRTEFKDNHILIPSSSPPPSSSSPQQNSPTSYTTNDSPPLPTTTPTITTTQSTSSTIPTEPTTTAAKEHFAEITSDDGYIIPNEPGMNDDFHLDDDVTDNISRGITLTSSSSSSRDTASGSDNENEVSSSYLQIVDNEDSSEDSEAKRLLEEITTKLTDPQNTPESSCNVLKVVPTTTANVTTPPSSSPPPQMKRDNTRRASEPPKPLTSQKSFEKEHQKLTKIGRKTISYSVDSSVPYSPPSGNVFKKTNAFPKQHSISHGNHDSVSGKADKQSNNPFDSLGSFFMTPTTRSQKVPGSQSFNKFPIAKTNVNRLRRNYTESVLSTPIKCPELDRNTKPKALRSKTTDGGKQQGGGELVINTSPDHPPAIPERVSPKPFTEYSNNKKQLKRSSYLDYPDPDEDIEQDQRLNEQGGKPAPPLPPKSKLLSLTRSAPIPTTRRSDICWRENNSLLRSSSLGITPAGGEQAIDLSQTSRNGSIDIKTETNTIDVPPEVPCRLPIHPLVSVISLFPVLFLLFSFKIS